MSLPRHLLLTTDTVGGVWTYALDLARGLVQHGYRTTLAILGPAPDAAQRQALSEVKGLSYVVTGLPLDWTAPDEASLRATAGAIAAMVPTVGADIVQVNAPALACLRDARTPLVVATHSCVATWWDAVEGCPMPEDFRWRTQLAAQGLAQADRCVVPSGAFGRAVARCYGLSRPPVTVHNGRFASPPASHAQHDFAFTAGRLWDRAKNAATMDAAAARLAVPFKAVGAVSGPRGERVEPLHLCLKGQVGAVEVSRYLAARPVFVSAARYEPFGLAVLEAAAAGCALVLSDIPTFRELWDDAAIFLPPGDDRGFAQAIDSLVGDMRWREERGAAAAARAARYHAQFMADATARLYDALLPYPARVAA